MTASPGQCSAIGACWVLGSLLSACALPRLPTPPVPALVYDLGPQLAPATTTNNANANTAASAPCTDRAALALAPTQAPLALQSTAISYRLAYAQAQQLRHYTLARWSMTPAQLLHLRLGQRLAQDSPVLSAGEPAALRELRIEIQEFSQLFTTPLASHGQVRVRATVLEPRCATGAPSQTGASVAVRQRSFSAQHPAGSADAQAGALALSAAADAVIEDIAAWLRQP